MLFRSHFSSLPVARFRACLARCDLSCSLSHDLKYSWCLAGQHFQTMIWEKFIVCVGIFRAIIFLFCALKYLSVNASDPRGLLIGLFANCAFRSRLSQITACQTAP